MILVKLGGSVITDKRGFRDFREPQTRMLAREISQSGKDVFLVHGAGSFGHVLAHKFSLQNGYVNDGQIPGVAEVMADVRDLNLRVVKALNLEGIHSVSIPPSAVAELDDGNLVYLETSLFDRYSSLGITPVTFGDVCLDRSKGFGICSGDQLMEWLAREFRPEKVIFCADVDGIFASDPTVDAGSELIPLITKEILESLPRTERYLDVTGSIYGKIESMLNLTSYAGECIVINGLVEGRLEAALMGEEVIGSRAISGE
ncbi:MAG: isopentenyl phosphate kinase family protein [Methanomassiliicoccales archaeon]|nr:isopentenyl phosphate kinase family protein [Methanomassiliicoccales archaeon]NYT16346.1 isopentenyl phosphate kinase family protein [Methanomassiliicoccales archaeon]